MTSDERNARPASLRERSQCFWFRHRRLFWTLHSLWALATGVVVVLLAHERYGFVPWIVGFLALTWASTLFFGQRGVETTDAAPPNVGQEVTSYLTRILYQETLFFLLPFYAYSTVLDSPNGLFLALLALLAVLACLDLLFDRWLRLSTTFALTFFATVTFAAVNLVLPMVAELPPRTATPLAAVIAIGTALPLALRGGAPSWRRALPLVGATLAIASVAVGIPSLVPPVPLRLDSAEFAAGIDPDTLALHRIADGSVTRAHFDGHLIVLARVFAPGAVPARAQIEWRRNGQHLRSSREVAVVAHRGGFRIWDAWEPRADSIPPGRYRVVLRTGENRVFGSAQLTITED